MFRKPVFLNSDLVSPCLQVQLDLAPAYELTTPVGFMPRRQVVGGLAAVRRRLEPPPGFSLAWHLVPAGELLLELAQGCGLSDLESVEALGAELSADLLWPEEPSP